MTVLSRMLIVGALVATGPSLAFAANIAHGQQLYML